MSNRNLLKGLVVHEDVIFTLLVEVLERTTLYAHILELLTNVETLLQYTTINYIFVLNAHKGVALARLYVKKLNYKIQTAVFAKTGSVFNVLCVDHK